MSSSSVGHGGHEAREGEATGPLRRRTRQTASRKLGRTEQVGFKVTVHNLAEIKAGCWKDGHARGSAPHRTPPSLRCSAAAPRRQTSESPSRASVKWLL